MQKRGRTSTAGHTHICVHAIFVAAHKKDDGVKNGDEKNTKSVALTQKSEDE